jgi:L-alanine-DL-glutamate epimerase-like enolase superfamily enzyme
MKIIRAGSAAFAQSSPDCLVELETDEGLTGIGIGPLDAGAEAASLARRLLLGEDPRAVVTLRQKLLADKPDSRAAALLDIALWDLKAKCNDEPLWKTLGGARPRANAYASVSGLSLTDDEITERFTDFAAKYGFGEGKLSVGLDAVSDTRRLGLVRDALTLASTCPVLMIDAGDRWTAPQAITNIKALEQAFDLTWVECSEETWSQDELGQVSDTVFAAVCSSVSPSVDRRPADIVRLNLQATGITGSLQLADAAYGFELPVTLVASPGNMAAHLAAAMPNFMNMEVRDPTGSDLSLTSDVRIEGGRAVAGDKPGHGLSGIAK